MKPIYHGGEKLSNQAKSPLFLYEEISDSIYFVSGYSSVENTHVTEFKLNDKAKILDLIDGNVKENEKLMKDIMKTCGLKFDENHLVENSYEEVGRDIYGCDIDLALYPKFSEELLKIGFNVIKNYSIIENTEPVAYAVLDSNVLDLQREYVLESDANCVYLEVINEQNISPKDSILGKSFEGMTGMGDIILKEIEVTTAKKKKM